MRFPRRSWLILAGALAAAAAIAATTVSATGSVPPAHHDGRTGSASASLPAGGSGRAHSPAAPSPTRAARVEPHVMVIVMENHGYGEVVGSRTAPYLNMLAARYGLATASYATAHPSLPNYLALVSGSTQGVVDDCTTCVANAPQLVDQLQRAGIGWRAFMEGAPRACFRGTAPPFDRHHDPFVYAPHIVENPAECGRIVRFAAFAPALAYGDLPPFVWVTPDVEHDMHTGTVAQGDAWLRRTLKPVLGSTWYGDGGIVMITFDEATGGTDSGCCTGAAGGHVMTVVISSSVPHGARLSSPLDGAGILRTIESLYRLPFLGAAANPRSGSLLALLGGRR